MALYGPLYPLRLNAYIPLCDCYAAALQEPPDKGNIIADLLINLCGGFKVSPSCFIMRKDMRELFKNTLCREKNTALTRILCIEKGNGGWYNIPVMRSMRDDVSQ